MAQAAADTYDVGAQPFTRRRLPPEQRRGQLLDVAADIVAEQGQAALTMERLAATAGVSNGLVYRYFDNRADVLLSLLEEQWSVLDAELAAAGSRSRSFDELVRAWTHVYLRAVPRRRPAFRRLNYEPSVEPLVEEMRQARRTEYLKIFAHNYRKQLGLTSEVSRTAAVMLLGSIEAAAARMGSMGSADLDADTIEAVQVALVMGGLEGLARGPAAR